MYQVSSCMQGELPDWEAQSALQNQTILVSVLLKFQTSAHFYTRSSVELQGLISGSAETKEQAAEGLGELIDVTSEKTLKEVVVPITGYDYLILLK